MTALGAGCRRFKSCLPDQYLVITRDIFGQASFEIHRTGTYRTRSEQIGMTGYGIVTDSYPKADSAFWATVCVRGADDCWLWQGKTARGGYGRYGRKGSASRYALKLATGKDPIGLFALHSCDNPPCCNPNHLRWGTHGDNMQDKKERGRWAGPASQSGAENGHAKLSEEGLAKVVERLQRGWDNSQCAQGLPIGHSMVSKIRTGKMWRAQSSALGWVPTPGTPKRNAARLCTTQVPA